MIEGVAPGHPKSCESASTMGSDYGPPYVGGCPCIVAMHRRYRFRVEPTPAQQQELARVFGCCRVVYNDALRLREQAFWSGARLSDSEVQRRVITEAKKTAERSWLAEVPSVALVQSVNDSRRAYSNFFASRSGEWKGRRIHRPRLSRRRTIGNRSDSPATGSACDPTGGCLWRRSAN